MKQLRVINVDAVGVGSRGNICPVDLLRTLRECRYELEARGIELGPWHAAPTGWTDCFVPIAAEEWLRHTPDYMWQMIE